MDTMMLVWTTDVMEAEGVERAVVAAMAVAVIAPAAWSLADAKTGLEVGLRAAVAVMVAVEAGRETLSDPETRTAVRAAEAARSARMRVGVRHGITAIMVTSKGLRDQEFDR